MVFRHLKDLVVENMFHKMVFIYMYYRHIAIDVILYFIHM